MGPTGHYRVVQIHLTRRCNLECRHCYSSSSPRATDALTPGVLRTALDELAGEGYTWASFSGGEPMLYPQLSEVLGHARSLGIRTGIVSNGMLLSPRRLDAIAPVTDLLVISLDGKPASHNAMRNSPKAFDTMAMRLPELRARDIDFGFLFTLTQHNLDELPWVVEFAVNVGAKALQIHPLDCFGNAAKHLAGKSPDALEGAYAWQLAEYVRSKLDGRLTLQVDLLHSELLQRHPDRFFLDIGYKMPRRPLAEQLSPLVVEPDGEVVPLQYGFARRFALGNLHRDSVHDMAGRWYDRIGPQLGHVARRVSHTLAEQPPQFIDWYALMASQARRGAGVEARLPLPRSDRHAAVRV
ncbi:MAG: radical SAM protein [Chromatiaceae bacterium]|nr:radical SAM protein [Gammaproteobacteria bacterium]MCP5300710.1 radical SAM protein [Chromatiaceae bacterium]MCP5422782.1 radical SAM protein [Chromatiaceae bacterium]